MKSTYQWAIEYIEAGFPVLKCKLKSKSPATKHGVHDATSNIETAKSFFDTGLISNIAIAAGNGLVVIDIDPKNGGDESLNRLREEYGLDWMNTPTVITSNGGLHLYYKCKDELSSSSPFRGIDLRAKGSYVIAPPSLHPSGHRYSWKEGMSFANIDMLELPNFLVSVSERNPISAIHVENIDSIPKGMRNTLLFRKACSLRVKKITKDEIVQLVKGLNRKCSPPLADAEVEKCVDSAWKYQTDFNLTDTGNAKRLVSLFGDNIRIISERKLWLIWNGYRWIEDHQYEMERFAKLTAEFVNLEAVNIDNLEKQKALKDWAKKSESTRSIKDMIVSSRSEVGVALGASSLDTNPMLLGVNNGTIDLATGEFRNPRKEDYITKNNFVDFDKNATCPLWIQFLHAVFEGDAELISFVQRVVGYCLTGITSERCLFIFLGSGANGKSVLSNIVKSLLGEYAQTVSKEVLLIKNSHSNNPNPEVARIKGSRFIAASETETNEKLASSFVKQLTGEDRITARFLNENTIEFKPQCKILICTNNEPRISGEDEAIWDRIRLVPFRKTFEAEERDTNLTSKLLEELPGILNWAIEGCMLWQQVGLEPSDVVRKATNAYRKDMDVIQEWLDSACKKIDGAIESNERLHSSLEKYCWLNGYDSISKNALSRSLTNRGYQAYRDSDGRGFKGIKIMTD